MAWRAWAWIALGVHVAPLAAAERVEIRFSEELGVADVRLAGARATRLVEFPWPRDWSALPGAELRLRLSHSATLDGERSFLAIALNHGLLRSLRLEPGSAEAGVVVVPLTPGMLREENQLVLSVVQFAAAGTAEEPWTLVSSASSLAIPFERKPVEWGLGDLPEPLLRRRGYEPRRLTVLVPSQASLATLEATTRCLAGLAARVAPEPVRLALARTLAEADTPAIVVGTPAEQPALRALSDLGAGTANPPATTGVAALLTEAGPNRQPILVVTGREPVAVGRAALGLFAPPAERGRVRLVPVAPARAASAPRAWRSFIPPANAFSLDAAGDPRAERVVAADLPARVRLEAPPDVRFLPWGHRATLVFDALPGLASDPRADLELYWNDVLLRKAPMEPLSRSRRFTLSASIPVAALRRANVLTVAWNGRSGATGPFLALRGDSTLFLPREYVAELPDLALLRSGLYPFGLRADLSEAVIGVPPGQDVFAALAELAVLLGRLAPSEEFRVRVASLEDAARSRGYDRILLETGDAQGLPPPDLARLPRGPALARLPFVQELESPDGDGHYVLRFRAATPALLRAALRSLGEPSVLSRLSGDTVFLAAEGPLAFQLAARRTTAEISYLDRLEAWVRGNWLALPLILAGISALLVAGLRLVLGHYRAARTARTA
jgi:hypothetical protein